uniref:Uncharacterized protein n=1 Tax=Zea mays TaxID=4577 RepID=C0PML0_MAIZE|nr:unknown [Zea mays]
MPIFLADDLMSLCLFFADYIFISKCVIWWHIIRTLLCDTVRSYKSC